MLLDHTTSKEEIYEEVKDIALESVAQLHKATRLTKAMEKKNLLLHKHLEAANRRIQEQESRLQEYTAKIAMLEEQLNKTHAHSSSASAITLHKYCGFALLHRYYRRKQARLSARPLTCVFCLDSARTNKGLCAHCICGDKSSHGFISTKGNHFPSLLYDRNDRDILNGTINQYNAWKSRSPGTDNVRALYKRSLELDIELKQLLIKKAKLEVEKLLEEKKMPQRSSFKLPTPADSIVNQISMALMLHSMAIEKENVLLEKELEAANRRIEEQETQLQEYNQKIADLEEQISQCAPEHNSSASELTNNDFLVADKPTPSDAHEDDEDSS
ncbi:uncharacterized protein V6R79_012646 [Siganus canaliculatus]